MHILITGGNGYIGLRLLAELSTSKHRVTACVRNADRIPTDIRSLYTKDRLQIIEIDFLAQPAEFPPCPPDIDVAYYLIHSMGGGDGFEARESRCAENFTRWISSSSAQQVVYLSGLLPELTESKKLSRHLASRERVYKILSSGNIPTTTLRASIIVGSGSASFEIIRDLVEKLPVMITPRWALTRCQPIAVRNVIEYLIGVMARAEALGKSYDIGGPTAMTYLDMLRGYAAARNLTRFVITVPVFTPRLSSYWLSLVTATNYQLAKALIGSLHMETICREHSIQQLIPLDLLSYEQAIEKAFSKIAQNRVPSTWYGALSSGKLSHRQIQSIQVPAFGVLTDQQHVPYAARKEQIIDAIWSLGGKNGWPNMLWAWKLRGLFDQLIGGIGMRRGRRSDAELKPGDALDFWRVIVADRAHGRLILYAEMKLPGEAWLSFQVTPDHLIQTATFRPKGLFGRLYWYAVLPFHLLLFPQMANTLASGWRNRQS
ncbi:MAG: SDR family oxidoreductase [Akkermansiaceae bacterium]